MKAWNDARDDAGEPQHGVLVVGHGTRDSAGLDEFREVVRRVAQRLQPTPVEPCFLEFAEPTIAAGVDRLAARGVLHFTVAPLVLFAAGHAKHDIPAAVAAATARHAGRTWHQAAHLGLHPRLVELSTLRYDEAVAELSHVAAEQMLRIVVGRGSTDPAAAAETREFARLCGLARPVGRVDTAFTALCEPRLDDVLNITAASPFRRIVVQPHLLFAGELVDRVRRLTAEAAARLPDRQWRATAHLGPHDLLVQAVVERIAESLVGGK